MSAPLLELTAVTKRFGRRRAPVLAGVDLALAPGVAVAVTGGNGAGKTTLLRICAGVVRPSGGHAAWTAGRIGWAPDRFEDAGRLTARELLRALAVGREETERLAAQLRFAAWLDRRLGDASKGTRHKVALAQALAGEPALVVLDEPWSDLDADARGALAGLLDARRAAGAAVVLSEHAAGPLAPDRRLALREGRLLPAGAGADEREAPDARATRRMLRVSGPAADVEALVRDARTRGLEVEDA